jgi:tRNA A37 threonylcarbamoyladenosine modification protein TsaB
MYLFIDTISEPTYIALFDEKRHIINTRTWPGKQKEFDTLTEEINDLIGQNNISYKMLSGIIVIV